MLVVHGEKYGLGSDIVVVLAHLRANKVSVIVTHLKYTSSIVSEGQNSRSSSRSKDFAAS